MPTLRALECLIAVLDAGSITDAAAALHMSQPALSHQLAALEREIGAPVVERLPRGVRATAVGRAVEADARAALSAADRVIGGGRAAARGDSGQLRLACAESLTASLLAPVLRTWLRRHPGLEVRLTEAVSADDLVRHIESGCADLAFGPRPSRWSGAAERIGLEEVVAVLSNGHPLADRDHLTFADLRDHPLVHYHPDNGLSAWLDTEAARHGTTLTPVMRTRQAATAAQLAAAGLGIALVPTTALTSGLSATLKRLRPTLSRDLVCLIGTPADPLVRRFTADIIKRGVPQSPSAKTQLDARR
ncbi:LysR family transcriptional regulator [Nocardia huaxiensis]|uniref:LysR family transcriptional regulator n=1 Tax=Nocardia huaxiensis TaxID=2755382 RepID=A0A7D6Z8S2_9NOCA|nr:LysR family transcriptional regulator [Nocardia huaxiensis]QLY29788.1 LysR family transcriptional regulator [Nocardia huaxiensis]